MVGVIWHFKQKVPSICFQLLKSEDLSEKSDISIFVNNCHLQLWETLNSLTIFSYVVDQFVN